MRRAGLSVTGLFAWFPRCPASYVSPWTLSMLAWFEYLDLWHKTPVDFGADPSELDPRYLDAMRVLKGEFARIEREELERLKERAEP